MDRYYIIIPVDTDEDPAELLSAAQDGHLYWPEQVDQDGCAVVECDPLAALEALAAAHLDLQAAREEQVRIINDLVEVSRLLGALVGSAQDDVDRLSSATIDAVRTADSFLSLWEARRSRAILHGE
jgi:hypothetical protein